MSDVMERLQRELIGQAASREDETLAKLTLEISKPAFSAGQGERRTLTRSFTQKRFGKKPSRTRAEFAEVLKAAFAQMVDETLELKPLGLPGDEVQESNFAFKPAEG